MHVSLPLFRQHFPQHGPARQNRSSYAPARTKVSPLECKGTASFDSTTATVESWTNPRCGSALGSQRARCWSFEGVRQASELALRLQHNLLPSEGKPRSAAHFEGREHWALQFSRKLCWYRLAKSGSAPVREGECRGQRESRVCRFGRIMRWGCLTECEPRSCKRLDPISTLEWEFGDFYVT